MAQKDNKELAKALRLEKSKNLKVRKNYRRLFTDVKRMEASVSVVLRLLNSFFFYLCESFINKVKVFVVSRFIQ